MKKARDAKAKLKAFSVYLDDRDGYTPGWKFNEWELKGVPLRIEVGPRDVAKNQVVMVRRDTGKKEAVKLGQIEEKAKSLLEDIQQQLFRRAENFLKSSIVEVKDWKGFEAAINRKMIAAAMHCGERKCEEEMQQKTGATARLIPFKQPRQPGKCLRCGNKAVYQVYFGRAY